MFKNLTLFRLPADLQLDLSEVEDALSASTFTPCGPTQDLSTGFVPPRGEEHGPLVESIGGHWIIQLLTETKAVPASVVREKAQEAADRIEATTGRKPGKKETKELREEARLALLPAAFPRRSATTIWIDHERRMLAIDATSQARIDDAVTALVRAIENFRMGMLHTTVAPMTAMTQWLSATDPAEWPGSFSVERACTLKSGDEEKSVVKFNRHNLCNDNVRKHITEGKLPTDLAMSFDSRVGFVLTAGMQLRKIAFLEGVFDGVTAKDSGFDADVAIATGELGPMIDALVEALGGEMVNQAQEGGAA
jgi:recombination associated protein RdgC